MTPDHRLHSSSRTPSSVPQRGTSGLTIPEFPTDITNKSIEVMSTGSKASVSSKSLSLMRNSVLKDTKARSAVLSSEDHESTASDVDKLRNTVANNSKHAELLQDNLTHMSKLNEELQKNIANLMKRVIGVEVMTRDMESVLQTNEDNLNTTGIKLLDLDTHAESMEEVCL